jgi:hypothetical protein
MHLDEITLEMSRHLLVAGATLAYGGHLGSAGYTEALFNLRAAHAASAPGLATDRIRNYVGWPLPYQTMDATKRLRYQHHLRFIRVPRPDGVADLEPTTFVDEPAYFPPSTPARRYAWARGMTALRERQTADTQARIIIGGKLGPTLHAQPDGTVDTKWYASRIPGLLEEGADLAARRRRPPRVPPGRVRRRSRGGGPAPRRRGPPPTSTGACTVRRRTPEACASSMTSAASRSRTIPR